ncbi:D-cysteine desulfhydrase family protein [Trinickia terrae]|uniref:D-cysteine desulfhydrase family protein n=2 Tax=Trinickia terrae TaxID=2571161 RepID=A0A4U1IDW2_9BURK|nr:D-cysteine desulfhydrase family protein [Trinickia terrae]
MPQLAGFPRFSLDATSTPIQPLEKLSRYLGGANIFVKRDDVHWIGGGGNKLRKLEFLIGQACKERADVVITVGGKQSNHARLTAAAAARAGLKCELVLSRMVDRDDEDYTRNGNVLIDRLFGATIHDLAEGVDPVAFAQDRINELETNGSRVFFCPLGGSSPIGCLGYVNGYYEIAQQEKEAGFRFKQILMANGSGGMQAGLLAGAAISDGDFTRIRGFTVLSDESEARANTLAKLRETALLLAADSDFPESAVQIRADQLGSGYGLPTEQAIEAIALVASKEAILLDPVYSGKAFAGLIEDIRTGELARGSNVLFILSGGVTSLSAYRRQLVR